LHRLPEFIIKCDKTKGNVMLSITDQTILDSIQNVIVHGGKFHADDLLTVAYLAHMGYRGPISRGTPTPADLDDRFTLVADVGGRHEPERLNFDHHQMVMERPDGDIPYAALGLVVGYFQPAGEGVYAAFDRRFVKKIDAQDNGRRPEQTPDRPYLSFSDALTSLNAGLGASCPEDADLAFFHALPLACEFVAAALRDAAEFVAARGVVESGERLEANRILVLERFVPWQSYVRDLPHADRLLYVVFPDNLRGGWKVQAVPERPGSMTSKLPLPEAWRGLNGEALGRLTGLSGEHLEGDAHFCAPSGFIGGAATKQGALLMARLALWA
jgi:uncharacterized UPF0160 family protein